jgi:hypothetical protein
MLFVALLGLAVLIGCWWVGDVTLLTKVIATLLFLASFALLFVPNYGFLFTVFQCVFIIVVGGLTFGLDWLTRQR